MKKITLLVAFLVNISLFAQNTYVPDDNFEQALIDLGYDSGALDNFVPTANINTITSLDVSNKNIGNLTGIQEFVALTVLNVDNNNLMTIDVTQQIALEEFYCSHNNISGSINVSNNTALRILNCGYNQLGAFDLSNNTALEYFSCYVNQLSYLNLSQNTALKRVKCQNNQLTYLNIQNGNNTMVSNANFVANSNPNLTCILVDDAPYSTTNWSNIDAQTSFNDVYCTMAGMTYVPDDNFEQALIDLGYDYGILDDQVPTANINAITSLDVSYKSIADLTGIEDFAALTDLNCGHNNLTAINVSNNTALQYLSCYSNQLTALDVTNNPALITIQCSDNTNLTSIDLSHNTQLENFYSQFTSFTSLNVSNNTALKKLKVTDNVVLTILDVSNNPALTDLSCYANRIVTMDVSNNPALKTLDCHLNSITMLDVSNNPVLNKLICYTNHLNYLNVKNGNNTNVTDANFDARNNPNLTCIEVDDATWSTANWSNVNSQSVFNDVQCPSPSTTYVPDDNFEQALIDLGYDSGALDNFVPTANINTITSLDVSGKNIADLTGITAFVALTVLNVDNNNLMTIDVTQQMALEELYCSHNNISGSINVSNNTALRTLNCGYNQLGAFDLSNNTALEYFSCYVNQLSYLNLSQNTALKRVKCQNNQLTYLNVKNGNNTAVTNSNFVANSNPNLTCILVDDAPYSTTNWSNIDAQTSFNDVYCTMAGMTYVPDDNFEQALIDLGYDSGILDDQVPTANINTITSLDVSNKSIADLTGIEDFAALNFLNCSTNSLTALDISTNTALTVLFCSENQLSGLNVTNNTALTTLSCNSNLLNTTIDLSQNTALTALLCSNNQLTALDLSSNTQLISLLCDFNHITTLDVSSNTALTTIYCPNNLLTTLNVKNGNNTAITNGNFNATNNPNLTCILVDDATWSTTNWTNIDAQTSFSDVQCTPPGMTYVPDDNFEQALIDLGYDSGALDDYVPTANINTITSLNVSGKNISDLTGITAFVALTVLNVYNNNLMTIDVTQQTALEQLYCGNNNLTGSIDVSNNTALITLSCGYNQLDAFDLSNNTALEYFSCFVNQLSYLNLSQNIALKKVKCQSNQLTYLNVKNGNNTMVSNINFNTINNPNLTCILVDDATWSTANWTNIDTQTTFNDVHCSPAGMTYVPDDNFEQALIDLGYDYGILDDQVPTANISAVTYLNMNGKGIADLTGIEDFAALTNLYCDANQLAAIDISHNTALTDFNCDNNQLTTLDVTANTSLINFQCRYNQLTTIDISNNTALVLFYCSHNQITSLNIAANTALTDFSCGANQLSALDVSNNTALLNFYCYQNQLTALDVSSNTALIIFDCMENQLTTINVSTNTALEEFYCNNNQLTTIDVSNTSVLIKLYCDNNQLTTIDISDCSALQKFYCGHNQLAALNVLNNTALLTISCKYNQLTALDVSNNTVLQRLYCYSNLLTALDVSNNTDLTTFKCKYNQLSALDISNNTALHFFDCNDNQLTTLNVKNGNNTALSTFKAYNNPNLTCILVDDATWSTTNWTNIDATSTFVNSQAECDALYVDDASLEDAINIYPNPAKNSITIANNGSDSIDQITIYNALGAVVYKANSIQNSIDTSSFKTGMYLVQLISDKKSLTKKLIIRK